MRILGPQRFRPWLPAVGCGRTWAMGTGLLLTVFGCKELEERLFTRASPQVEQAKAALRTEDAGLANSLLSEYLSTGRCKDGNLGTPSSLRDKPSAAINLGLALFQIAERFGEKFDAPPGPGAGPGAPHPAGVQPPPPGPEPGALLAQRSAQVDCALRVVRIVAASGQLEPSMKAEAYYLSGNLEFLRHNYQEAVDSYDSALSWVPAGAPDAGTPVGEYAAWNRAIALRRIQEEEDNKAPEPDAGTQPPSDGGQPQDDQDKQDQDKQDQDKQDQDKQDQDKQDQDKQDQDKQDQDKQDQDKQDQDKQDQGKQDQAQEKSPQPQPAASAPPPSLSQDDRMLEELERAPMIQHESPRARGAGRVRMEDK